RERICGGCESGRDRTLCQRARRTARRAYPDSVRCDEERGPHVGPRLMAFGGQTIRPLCCIHQPHLTLYLWQDIFRDHVEDIWISDAHHLNYEVIDADIHELPHLLDDLLRRPDESITYRPLTTQRLGFRLGLAHDQSPEPAQSQCRWVAPDAGAVPF